MRILYSPKNFVCFLKMKNRGHLHIKNYTNFDFSKGMSYIHRKTHPLDMMLELLRLRQSEKKDGMYTIGDYSKIQKNKMVFDDADSFHVKIYESNIVHKF